MNERVYQAVASSFQAYLNCLKSGNAEWEAKHRETIEYICKNHLPSGSGIDCGTKFDFDASKPDKLVFLTSYHHMNDAGMYDGWTEHSVIITPNWRLFDIKITGRDRNQIKEYLADVYSCALQAEDFVLVDCGPLFRSM